MIFKDKEAMHKAVMTSLVENGIYRGMKFLFLCVLESGNEIIDAINLADWEHDARFDINYAIERGWVFCRNRKEAFDYADSVYDGMII